VSLAEVDDPVSEVEVGRVVSVVAAEVTGAVAEVAGAEADPPGVPATVEAAEREEAPLVELAPSTSFSVMLKGELIARISVIFETPTNWRVKPSPAVKRGRGIPTEPREVWILLATPMLGLNCVLTSSMEKAVGSEGVLVQVTALVALPIQFEGVLIVKALAEAASKLMESMVDANMVAGERVGGWWEEKCQAQPWILCISTQGLFIRVL